MTDPKQLKWSDIKDKLTPNDIARFACCYFHCNTQSINYAEAAEDFGSKTANSFRVMLGATLKKGRDAGTSGGVASDPKPGQSDTPKGRKRKNDESNHDNEEGGHDIPETKVKKRGVKKQEKITVKQEPEEEMHSDTSISHMFQRNETFE